MYYSLIMAFQLTFGQKIWILKTIYIIDFPQNALNVQSIPKKHGLRIDKMFNIFGSLVIEEVSSYPSRNIPNLIFIRLKNGSLLVI